MQPNERAETSRPPLPSLRFHIMDQSTGSPLRRLRVIYCKALFLLRHEIASSGVTVRATLREHFLGETGHERGSAGTVYGLRRGARRGDRACRSGGAVA